VKKSEGNRELARPRHRWEKYENKSETKYTDRRGLR